MNWKSTPWLLQKSLSCGLHTPFVLVSSSSLPSYFVNIQGEYQVQSQARVWLVTPFRQILQEARTWVFNRARLKFNPMIIILTRQGFICPWIIKSSNPFNCPRLWIMLGKMCDNVQCILADILETLSGVHISRTHRIHWWAILTRPAIKFRFHELVRTHEFHISSL